MKRTIVCIVCLLFLPILANAQGVKGRIINQDGEPLAFATIYVSETESGSVSNSKGVYELRLSPGTYHISFQFLGYASQQETVTIGEQMVTRDIILQRLAYLLGEAEVESGDEDPAYKIMRKAIAKSSFHRLQVDHYTCEVYLKGRGRLVDVPWYLRKVLEKEGIDTSTTFVTESVSIITYTRPGKYKEHVVSVRSSGDDQNTSPMIYINSSFYEPEIGGLVSPFSPKAFAYYKFQYIHTFEDRGYQIDEIRVIPRSKGEDVFAGKIYVVEDLWAIHSIDLSFVVQGIDVHVSQIFAPIQPNLWMPVSHKYDGSGSMMGVEFEFQYFATVSDYDITLNPDLSSSFTLLDEKTEKEEIEARASEPSIKLDKAAIASEKKLMKGEEVTRKELRKLMRKYQKIERKKRDEPVVIGAREIKIDSTAATTDSSYWALKRPIPLTDREIKGYDIQDSLALEQKKHDTGDTLNSGKKFNPKDILLGNTYALGNDNYFRIKNNLTSIRFNTVDGWNFKYAVSYLKRIDASKRLEITPTYRYAFARNQSFGTLKTEYRYGEGLKKGKINLIGGYYYRQFNKNEPIATFTDAISSLFVERHYMRVYDRTFIQADWNEKLRHNLTFSPHIIWAHRIETFNNTDLVWFPSDERDYPPNAPVSIELPNTHFGESKAFKVALAMTYRPWSKYYRRGEKYFRVNNPPTITARYEKAIPGVLGSSADYGLATLEIKYRFDLNLFGKIDVRTEAGKFIDTRRMDFMDYHHFMGNQTIFTRFAQMKGYSIAPYYTYSTNDAYLSTYINYQFRRFIFSNIRALRITGIKENININHLLTPTINHYTELSYSIDNLFRFFRIDVTTAFLDGVYEDFRIQVGITTDLVSFK